MIQYPREVRDRPRGRGVLGRPVKPGDDSGIGFIHQGQPASRYRTRHDADGQQSAFSQRHAPELCPNASRLEIGGRRECRVRAAPAVSCAKENRKRTRAYRFSGGNPTFPAQWFDGLWRALPGDQDLFVAVALRMMAGLMPGWAGFASARLDTNHEASGPHDFAVRDQHHSSARRPVAHRLKKPALQPRHPPDAAASTASRPASLTIRIRPSVGRDGEG
jgi:hypothetical protein